MATFKVIGVGEPGKYMDDAARQQLRAYCLRADKAIGGRVGGMAVNPYHAEVEMSVVAKLYHKDDGLRLRHWVVSFAPWELDDPAVAEQIAWQMIRFYGERYQILFSVHEDTEHLHVHFFMNVVSFVDGRKYHGSKADYYNFIAHMKEVLLHYQIPLHLSKGETE